MRHKNHGEVLDLGLLDVEVELKSKIDITRFVRAISRRFGYVGTETQGGEGENRSSPPLPYEMSEDASVEKGIGETARPP